MFGKALQFRAKVALFVAGATLFLVGSLSMLQKVYQHDTVSLPGCALMVHGSGHGTEMCPMDAVTHFTNLQSMFSVISPIVSALMVLSLIAFVFAVSTWLFIKRTFVSPETSFYLLLRLLAPKRNLRLQEAFSQGILHSKAY